MFQQKSDRRGTNRGIPKLSRNEEKRTDLFQKISDQRGKNGSIPQLFRNEERPTDVFQKIPDRRKTNHFDSDLAEKNSEKNEGSSFLGTKAKDEGLRSKKRRGFAIATR